MAIYHQNAALAAAICLALLQGSIAWPWSSPEYERIREDILAWQLVPANQAQCGTDPGGKLQSLIQNYDSCQRADFRIVNGCEVTDPSPIGWNCAVLTETQLECTGTLLTPTHVAVVAKCLEGLSYASQVQVLINNTIVRNRHGKHPEDAADLFKVKAFGVHPYFNGKTFENNMGVIELEKPVPMGQFGIRPACLPKNAANLQTLRGCVMTSFGMTHKPKPHVYKPPKLALGLFGLSQYEVCEKVYPPFLRARQLCAEGKRAGSSTNMCVGDFGAGLLCKIDNVWTMIGMSSYTAGDCQGPAAFNDMWSGFTEKDSSAPAENTAPAPTDATTESTTKATTTTTKATTTAASGEGGQLPEVPGIFNGIIQQWLKPFKQFAAIVG